MFDFIVGINMMDSGARIQLSDMGRRRGGRKEEVLSSSIRTSGLQKSRALYSARVAGLMVGGGSFVALHIFLR